MNRRISIIVACLVTGAAACGGSSGDTRSAGSTSAAASTSAKGVIVGEWTARRGCDAMYQALVRAGLRVAAAPVLGDFFPGSTPRQLARKTDICAGAGPAVRHSHFFTPGGSFGSLDENYQQVDDGRYAADGSDLYICDSDVASCTRTTATGHFRYSLRGDELRLTPFVTAAQHRKALAHPFGFSQAGWMVAVAMPGLTWTRTACSEC